MERPAPDPGPPATPLCDTAFHNEGPHPPDALVERVVVEALAAIGVEVEVEQRRTRALVDGLVLDTCLGRTTPEQAVTVLEAHVASLVAEARRAARA